MADPLPLASVVGFSGQVSSGLIAHPDGDTVIYPLGSTIVLRSKTHAANQEFLRGHTDQVSCLALSRSGRYLASGQLTYMGFTADIIIWDLQTKQLKHKLRLHKVKVQALDFSYDDSVLASLGGHDDNSLVLWNVEAGTAMCGSPTHSDFTLTLKFFSGDRDRLVTAGKGNIHVWEYNARINKLQSHSIAMGKMVRQYACLDVAPTDEYIYAGTLSGDLLQINLERNVFRVGGPKTHVTMGITACTVIPGGGHVLVGGGDGLLGIMKPPPPGGDPRNLTHMPLHGATQVEGGVTSISIDKSTLKGDVMVAYVGTALCNIYQVIYDLNKMHISAQLVQSAHHEAITSIAFPAAYGEVFATASYGEIRLWNINTCREMLRIKVPNLECACIAFMSDGRSIISGWSDGKIRAFAPQTGKLLYTVNEAHHKAVTAIAGCVDGERIISGGEEGTVRVWQVSTKGCKMIASMKDHKAAVNAIVVKESTNDEAVSASNDGSCIVWDLLACKRRTSMFANTFFKSIAYHPDDSQLITTGTDRKLTYWDAYDGSAIRIVDASETSSLSDVHVDVDGEVIASCGGDKVVQVWGYDEGQCYFVGVGHSGTVNRVRVSPDKRFIVSVGAEGAIFIWNYAKPSTATSVTVEAA